MLIFFFFIRKVHQEKVNAVFDACAVKNIKIGMMLPTKRKDRQEEKRGDIFIILFLLFISNIHSIIQVITRALWTLCWTSLATDLDYLLILLTRYSCFLPFYYIYSTDIIFFFILLFFRRGMESYF